MAAGAGAGAAADTTADAADVTGAAADATGAGTAGAELTDGVGAAEGAKVAACACRENTSKTTRIPAAAIATCIARRAMCRKIGCSMQAPTPPGQARPGSKCPSSAARNAADKPLFQAFAEGNPGTGHLCPHRNTEMSVLFGHHRTALAQARTRGPADHG